MLDILWQVFLGSLIVLATALVWVVIAAIIITTIRQIRNPGYRHLRTRHEKQIDRVEEELERDRKP